MSHQNNSDKNYRKGSLKKGMATDKHLVTEQSGMKVFLFGLIFSIVSGLLIKSALSPNRIAQQVERAASHIHKDLTVKFKEAQFSLSNGILPRAAVVISDVEFSFRDACSVSSDLKVDELRLPISFWGMMTGKPSIKTIEADMVTLSLRGKAQDCKKTKSVALQVGTTTQPRVTLSPRGEGQSDIQKYGNIVNQLSIGDMKIYLEDYPQYPLELMDLVVKMNSFEPRVIEARAKTHLLHDDQVGGYMSSANLFAQYNESTEPQIQTHIYGNWREGHYSIIANYTISDHFLNIETDVKHIPLSQIINLLQKYKLVSNDVKPKQVWVSSLAHMAGEVEKLKVAPMEIRNFHVEGDLGEISSPLINLTSLNPLQFRPIQFEFNKINVHNLLAFLNHDPANKMLGDLGLFTGQMKINSEKSIQVSGEHQGLEFIFSNKGQRELQVIEKMSAELNFIGDQWTLAVNNIAPKEGRLKGSFNLKADKDLSDVFMNAKLQDLVLAPQVQKLMTNGGDVGDMNFMAEGKLKNGKWTHMKGGLVLNKMNIEGMGVGRTSGDFILNDDVMTVKTKVDEMQITSGSAGAIVMNQLIPKDWWENSKIEIQDLNGQFQWKDMSHFQWKGFQAKLGKSKKINLEGAWDDSGRLKGSALIRDGKWNKKFILSGDREHPLLTADSPDESRSAHK